MVNIKGINGWGEKSYPSDEELREYLLGQAKTSLTVPEKILRLKLDIGLEIGRSKYFELQKRLGIPSIRKPGLSAGEVYTAVVTEVTNDTMQLRGPNAVKENLKNKYLILMPRRRIREIMWEVAPDGFNRRFPGRLKQISRQPLTSVGPFREISADGHEKLNKQALRMGNLSIPIYAYRDKWSGCILKLCAIPDARKAAGVGHIYLDLVEQWKGIPVQLTTDKGSEIGWQTTLQALFREFYAPNLDPNIFPTSVVLPSTHNTTIESIWRWLREKTGLNLKEIILRGKNEHIFHAHEQQHHDLFYWIFIPLIQQELDIFVEYWNNKKTRRQKGKLMPSGHIPADALRHPHLQLHKGRSCLIQIPEEALTEMRTVLSEEVGERSEHLSWYTQEFGDIALAQYKALGSPLISLANAWEIFTAMAHSM